MFRRICVTVLVMTGLASSLAIAARQHSTRAATISVVLPQSTTTTPTTIHVTTTTVSQAPYIQRLNMAKILIAESHAQAVRPRPQTRPHILEKPTIIIGSAISVAAPSGGLSDVVQCIKNHESGNYSESSHIWDGSGAYQFIPKTWRYYFGRWKASLSAWARFFTLYYDLAYQAPPSVQDAVLDYALHNGGAGNWSPRYGNDPCTVGMGG